MQILKPLLFRGNSLVTLREFPKEARQEAGLQLDRVQRGLEPNDWKPMDVVGSGSREIRIRDARGIYRVLYVSKFGQTIYVLHCFVKKTQKTAASDLEIATRRYKEIQKEYQK